MKTQVQKAFTLIELLIVVLIIAILAAIAVPNFLEFQTRAKVARVKSDMRTAVTALEAYAVDNDAYPILRLYHQLGNHQWNRGGIWNCTDLTTPIAYLTNVNIPDPFQPPTETDAFGDIPQHLQTQGRVSKTINYINIDLARAEQNLNPINIKFALVSYGPDLFRGAIPGVANPFLGTYKDPKPSNNYFKAAQYDPTNGTVSSGDIIYYQGIPAE